MECQPWSPRIEATFEAPRKTARLRLLIAPPAHWIVAPEAITPLIFQRGPLFSCSGHFSEMRATHRPVAPPRAPPDLPTQHSVVRRSLADHVKMGAVLPDPLPRPNFDADSTHQPPLSSVSSPASGHSCRQK